MDIKVSEKFKRLVEEASFPKEELEELKGYVRVLRPKEFFFVNPPLALKQAVERFKKLQNSKDKHSIKKAELIVQLLKDNRLYKEFENVSIFRDPQEVEKVFKYNVSMLYHLCKEFDKGRTESILWIAVILRTLIHTHYSKEEKRYTSLSIVDQLNKNIAVYLSSSFPKPDSDNFIQGWRISNLSNTSMTAVSIYAGLILKELKMDKKGRYIADFVAMGDSFPEKNRYIKLSEWFNEEVFYDKRIKLSLTRWQAISMVANKDGGAHFDPNVPPLYDAFRGENLFKIRCNNIEVKCSINPVHVTVRQIAWEVLETFKHYNLIKEKKMNN